VIQQHRQIDVRRPQNLEIMMAKMHLERLWLFYDISEDSYRVGETVISGDVADPNLLFRLRFRLDNYRLVYKTFCNTLVDWISKMGGLLTAFLGFFTLLSF
jgi:hypothetical protein